MKPILAIIALMLVGLLFGAMNVSATGIKMSEPEYGKQYTPASVDITYNIPFREGSNISINVTGFTGGGSDYYTVFWYSVNFTKSYNDADLLAGDYKMFMGGPNTDIWMVSSIDQVLKLRIWSVFSLKYTINMTNVTAPPPPDLTPIYNLINGLNQTINGLNATLQNLTGRTTGIEANITSLIAQVNSLKAQVENNTINITVLQATVQDLQTQINGLQTDFASINAIVTNNVNVTNNITNNITNVQTTDLAAVNQSLTNLSDALDALNATVQAIDVPPDLQSEVTDLQVENAQLKTDLTALEKNVSGISPNNITNNVTQNVTYHDTVYNNSTITKRAEMDATKAIAMGGGVGGLIGFLGGMIGGAAIGRRKEGIEKEVAETSRLKDPDDAIPEAKAEKVSDDDEIDDILEKIR